MARERETVANIAINGVTTQQEVTTRRRAGCIGGIGCRRRGWRHPDRATAATSKMHGRRKSGEREDSIGWSPPVIEEKSRHRDVREP
jgi:hypothetical protein